MLGDARWLARTGTFFWDRTTAQSLPLMPTDMMLAAVMALKAYSVQQRAQLRSLSLIGRAGKRCSIVFQKSRERTNLI